MQLEGFPCVRGGAINGFVVSRNLGSIEAGRRGLFFPGFGSANDARDALVGKARWRGANAIVNYTWHNDRQRLKGFFGNWYNKDWF